MQISNDERTDDYLKEWVESTERIIGAGLKKRKVKVSDPTRENIRVQILKMAAGYRNIHFIFRDSLRFVDMGAGRGYHKGKRITQDLYRDQMRKGRRRKRITNKPIYGRIAALKQVVAAKVIQDIQNDFQILEQ